MKTVTTDKGEHEVKEGDVFHAYWKDYTKGNHCFEGLLTAKVETEPHTGNTRIILVDNFWRTGGNKWFTFKEANEQLDLTYYANLNDFDLTQSVRYPQGEYLTHDFIFMHDQHACVESCKYFFLRKGAKKSKVIMLHTLEKKLQEAVDKQASMGRKIQQINETITKVHKGEEVYI